VSRRDQPLEHEPILLHSLDNEKAALASMLFGPKAVSEVLGILKSEMLFYAPHRLVCDAIERLHFARVNVDPLTLESELDKSGELEAVGGRAAILDIAEATYSPSNGRFYAENVRQYWALRRIDDLGKQLERDSRTPHKVGDNISTTIQAAINELSGILSAGSTGGLKLGESDREKPRVGHPSKFPTLNDMGEYPGAYITGQVSLIGGKTGAGKSFYLIQEAEHLIRTGLSGCYYSLTDLGKRDIERRMMRVRTGFSELEGIRSSDIAQAWSASWFELTNQNDDPFGSEFYIYTGRRNGQTIDDVEAMIRAQHAAGEMHYAIVDYLQALRPTKAQARMGRFDRIEENAQRLEWLADDLNIALLVATQISTGEGGVIPKGGRTISEAASLWLWLEKAPESKTDLIANVEKLRYGASNWKLQLSKDERTLAFTDCGVIE